MQSLTSHSLEETFQIAADFAKGLRKGSCVLLRGELGAGKTAFAKGMIAALSGLPHEEIPSPSFTLVEEYPGNPGIYHVDLFRLDARQAANDIPWEDMLHSDHLTIVEWPERYPELEGRGFWEISMKPGLRSNIREISLEGGNPSHD